MSKEIFAKNIKKLRLQNGWSQRGLAKKIGVTDTCIGRIENQSRNCSLHVALAIARVLGTTIEELTKTEE